MAANTDLQLLECEIDRLRSRVEQMERDPWLLFRLFFQAILYRCRRKLRAWQDS